MDPATSARPLQGRKGQIIISSHPGISDEVLDIGLLNQVQHDYFFKILVIPEFDGNFRYGIRTDGWRISGLPDRRGTDLKQYMQPCLTMHPSK